MTAAAVDEIVELSVFSREKEVFLGWRNIALSALFAAAPLLPSSGSVWIEIAFKFLCSVFALIGFISGWSHLCRGWGSSQGFDIRIAPSGLTLNRNICPLEIPWSEIEQFKFDKRSFRGANDCVIDLRLRHRIRSLTHPFGSNRIIMPLGEWHTSILEIESAMRTLRLYLWRAGWRDT
ncbi:hypothetical protein [Sphingopyxis macrogoltabida]|uniref:Uncharacterized protein n=1 Tax=Sphingopyxis macrogoltabida TaxID=33050 RepID=A0A0N9US38_SPHMC|nr:hypothetical protein [Sphingopyxis macrogoltabida]ALH79377.1 hypothetical protein AN936_03040 [Sphingopyxis macrogoltabida]